MNKVKYDISGNNNLISIGQNSKLSNTLIYIRGNNHELFIGKDCHYKGGSIWFEDINCHIRIGDKTTVESAHLAVTEPQRQILIGRDCMLATNIELRTGDSHSIFDNRNNRRLNYAADINIEDHVWIGANAVVLKGVTVATNAVIATNSVVTKNIPASSVAAGSPAKVIRENITWSRERVYDE